MHRNNKIKYVCMNTKLVGIIIFNFYLKMKDRNKFLYMFKHEINVCRTTL